MEILRREDELGVGIRGEMLERDEREILRNEEGFRSELGGEGVVVEVRRQSFQGLSDVLEESEVGPVESFG